jgi:Tol biopolymer transport system component
MTRHIRLLMPLAAAGLLSGIWLAAPPLRAQQEHPLVLSQLTWFDRAGTMLGEVGPLADHGDLELSPDGSRIAVAVADRALGTHDLWIYDAGDVRRRVTSEPADENWLAWSADGATMVLNSFTPTRLALLVAPVADATRGREVLTSGAGMWPVSWSPDGRNLLYVTSGEMTGNDVWVLPLDGDRSPYPFAATRASENWAAFSPDGRWVAYSTTESSDQPEVWVAPFPQTGRRWRVSADGGTQARWRRQDELLYLAPDRRLMSVTLRIMGDDLVTTDIQPLFRLTFPYGSYHAFDVTPDGQRILVNQLVISPNAPTLSAALAR